MSPPAPRAASRPVLQILGSRGIPNRHGGFEAFAEELAPFLAERGWDVTVYCQEDADGRAADARTAVGESSWRGVRLVHVPVRQRGALGTIVFDWRSTRLAAARPEPGIALVLGYNTAAFCAVYRARGVVSVLNMDGMEWKRAKYSLAERAWFYVNEWLGCLLADHLVADHPEIARRLARRVDAARMTTIPYGARAVSEADPARLAPFGLEPGAYALLIARPEPENSILEVVRAYGRGTRRYPLAVLGLYRRDVAYERRVRDAAGPEVRFLGPVYDRAVVDALRRHARLYVHGHTAGGTNPALVEALGAGTPVLAHDNPFNRWVCGPASAAFFRDEHACAAALDALLPPHADARRAAMSAAARQRHADAFTLPVTLGAYEAMLRRAPQLRAARGAAEAGEPAPPGAPAAAMPMSLSPIAAERPPE